MERQKEKEKENERRGKEREIQTILLTLCSFHFNFFSSSSSFTCYIGFLFSHHSFSFNNFFPNHSYTHETKLFAHFSSLFLLRLKGICFFYYYYYYFVHISQLKNNILMSVYCDSVGFD